MARWPRAEFKPEFCEKLIDHLEAGGNLKSFAPQTGYSYSVVYRWLRTQPEFADAFDLGETLKAKNRRRLPRIPDPNEVPNLIVGYKKAV